MYLGVLCLVNWYGHIRARVSSGHPVNIGSCRPETWCSGVSFVSSENPYQGESEFKTSCKY